MKPSAKDGAGMEIDYEKKEKEKPSRVVSGYDGCPALLWYSYDPQYIPESRLPDAAAAKAGAGGKEG